MQMYRYMHNDVLRLETFGGLLDLGGIQVCF